MCYTVHKSKSDMSRTLNMHHEVWHTAYLFVSQQLRHPACPNFSLFLEVKKFQEKKKKYVVEDSDKSYPCRNIAHLYSQLYFTCLRLDTGDTGTSWYAKLESFPDFHKYSVLLDKTKFKLNTARKTIDQEIVINAPRAIIQKQCIYLPSPSPSWTSWFCTHTFLQLSFRPLWTLFPINHSFDFTCFQQHYWNKDKTLYNTQPELEEFL